MRKKGEQKTGVKPTTSKSSATTKAPIPKAAANPKAATNPKTTTKTAKSTAVKAKAKPSAKKAAASPIGKHAARPTDKKAAEPSIKRQPPPWLVYVHLMRLHRPIGTLLLLWPTLWSLCLAAGGFPRWDLLLIFTLGVVLMRSAGCVINDFADRKIDGHVLRTKDRPLATGQVSSRAALFLFVGLCLLSFGLVLLTNKLTLQLSFGGLLLAACYPFMKRHTHLPQIVLGAAFAWSIPMAFAAQLNTLPKELWLVYLAVVLWTVVYDTFYAMVDRDDDRRIGVKSTAILFGDQDRVITASLQALTLYSLVLVGQRFELGLVYYLSLGVAGLLFAYQQYLIRFRERDACFKAFLNNHWVGMVICVGILIDLSL